MRGGPSAAPDPNAEQSQLSSGRALSWGREKANEEALRGLRAGLGPVGRGRKLPCWEPGGVGEGGSAGLSAGVAAILFLLEFFFFKS